MTDAVPWVKWRFDKWRGDEGLRMCSLAARGLWIELLSIMHGCDPYGHLTIKGKPPTPKQIAGLVGMTSEREVASLLTELEEAGVFSRSQAGLIYSRRLTRDNTARLDGKRFGKDGGNPTLLRGDKAKGDKIQTGWVNPPPYPRDKSQEPEKESKQPRTSSFAGMAGVTPDAETGRPTCNGWYLDSTRERIYEAARIDDTKWRGHEGDAITDWLISGIEPDTIVGAIRDCVARQGGKYTVPGTLKYFNGAVTDAHGRRPTSTRLPPILTCEGKAAP